MSFKLIDFRGKVADELKNCRPEFVEIYRQDIKIGIDEYKSLAPFNSYEQNILLAQADNDLLIHLFKLYASNIREDFNINKPFSTYDEAMLRFFVHKIKKII